MKKHIFKIAALVLVLGVVILAVAAARRVLVPMLVSFEEENITSCSICLDRAARKTLAPPGKYPLSEDEQTQLVEYLNDTIQNHAFYRMHKSTIDGFYPLFIVHYTDGSTVSIGEYGDKLYIDGFIYDISASFIEEFYDSCYIRVREENKE